MNQSICPTIYVLNIEGLREEALQIAALSCLTEERRERLEKIKSEQGRLLAIGAGLLERYILSKIDYSMEEMHSMEIQKVKKGKPVLFKLNGTGEKVLSAWQYNLSHSGNYVVAGYTKGNIGIDIQEPRNIVAGFARKVCAVSELTFLDKLSEKEKNAFLCRLWTVKEAFAKLTGEGLSIGFERYRVDWSTGILTDLQNRKKACFREMDLSGQICEAGYTMSVCTYEKSELPGKIVFQSVEELL
ncbi:MAG: 4'-phosphopantetheinyl transferase superfamily protein [Lachnospiraceae bacterium]|nr:4'-phosphopantetheinyl transferase superfamily protein [Lachnospiraceae bacterium]